MCIRDSSPSLPLSLSILLPNLLFVLLIPESQPATLEEREKEDASAQAAEGAGGGGTEKQKHAAGSTSILSPLLFAFASTSSCPLCWKQQVLPRIPSQAMGVEHCVMSCVALMERVVLWAEWYRSSV
eukprot:839155-Rhodomonas_salina.1